ncbi:MAG TPA: lipopolysaccharide heptosyltransferase II [Smithella sp.]|nr:lipopolysaccharide heptosyltransferase II [Smithella sp.]HOG89270.1 lipopolysaccharide heptosyltransferase II [Smithella sp.]
MIKKNSKILVTRFSSLGDIVLTTPVYHNLKLSYPECKIYVAVKEKFSDILEGNPYIDNLIVLKNGESLFSLIRRIRSENFDVFIDLHNKVRSFILRLFCGIPRIIVYRKNTVSKYLYIKNSRKGNFLTQHTIEKYLDVLQEVGIQPTIKSPEIFVDHNLNDFCERHNIRQNDLLVGINPGSVWPTKKWLPERFAEVADWLTAHYGAKIVVIGSNNDRDDINKVLAASKHPHIDLCGKTSLRELATVISQCALFITNDSGPMHIAAALQVPLVAIFGSTTKELGFTPYGTNNRIVEVNLPCRPCSSHGKKKCPEEHFKCMRDISSGAVIIEAKFFLDKILADTKALGS